MLKDWFRRARLTGEKSPSGLPRYAALQSVPSRRLPPQLVEKEAGTDFARAGCLCLSGARAAATTDVPG